MDSFRFHYSLRFMVGFGFDETDEDIVAVTPERQHDFEIRFGALNARIIDAGTFQRKRSY